MSLSNPILYILTPCYNEEDILPYTIKQLSEILNTLVKENGISKQSSLLLVDDGSTDKTWQIIKDSHRANSKIAGLKLAINAGHQNALLAGLMSVKEKADCVISLDADLQDDPAYIKEFLGKYKEGYDIIYGVRSSRETDTAFKRTTARWFYKLMSIMGVKIIPDHADYRLISKRALNVLADFKEINLFLRGIVPLLGFKSTKIYYIRNKRIAGKSKYPLKKMFSFAFDGITSFSVMPIRVVSAIGIIIALLSVIFTIYAILVKILGHTTTGWTSLTLSIWLIGAIQLICLGLIGEYIGKIYKEVKHRPRYIIEEEI